MLSTIEYLSLLRKYMRENAVKYGISRMGIFGSVARGEQHDGSDVDICVEIDRPSIFTLVHIKEELEKLTLGGLRKAVFDGDVKHGSVMMGQVAGMCKEIRPLKDIFASLIQESQEEIITLNEKVKGLIYAE